MSNYDFCLAWNWEYDLDFVRILERTSVSRGVSFLQVTPDSLLGALESLERGELSFWAFLDRASEADPNFLPLVKWANLVGIYNLNPLERSRHAMNKASMHLEFITAGIHTPYTIILPPFAQQPDLPPLDLSPLGGRFTIKPAHGGGGEGVVIEATSLEQVFVARQEFRHDYYLLQAHIVPARVAGRSAWFRVIYCGGRVYPSWWDITTHVYEPVTGEEEVTWGLTPLYATTETIARVCRLDIFSTEIALTPAGQFVAVDYVNDQIDLRVKSNTFDGVPDDIVCDVAERLVELVQAHRPPQLPPILT
jgi:hypothetical protein